MFETKLDQHEALARLSERGTLAVMPSLEDNSPNTVYECLERSIPFMASNVGGIPELVAPEDRPRVLFEPTAEGVAAGFAACPLGGERASAAASRFRPHRLASEVGGDPRDAAAPSRSGQ